MEENHVALTAALAKLWYWTNCLAEAAAAGDIRRTTEAQRSVNEYTTLVAQMGVASEVDQNRSAAPR